MHIILHKMADGGVDCRRLSQTNIRIMMGGGMGWTDTRIEWEVEKLMMPAPAAGWVGYSRAMATEWATAQGKGGLTEDEVLDLLKRRVQERRGYTVSEIMDDSLLPKEISGDRYFRDAVVWDDAQSNKCNCDMPTARAIHLTEIRRVRNAELVKEDGNMLKAIEAEDASAQSTVKTKKQVLRDLPATFDITTDAGTPELLKGKWPTELPARE